MVFPVHPDFVDHEKPQIVMGKKSGLDNVYLWAEKLNIELNEDETMAVLKEIKLQSHGLKRVITEEEFLGDSEKEKTKIGVGRNI